MLELLGFISSLITLYIYIIIAGAVMSWLMAFNVVNPYNPFLTLATLLMVGISSAGEGYVAAAMFGFGIGGLLTLLPIAWADYFGRANFAAIRGVALSAQVLAQATGPLLSGALRDWTGSYTRSLQCFAVLSVLSVIIALAARRPRSAGLR